jgi:predicted metal-dependent HD superfamily phosphohydrolase
LHVPAATVAAVAQLIVQTKTHHVSSKDRDGCVLLDADLAILGAPAADYRAYARAIRQEYAWVPDEHYRTGRQEVLRSFLQRERIYKTEQLHQESEAQARRNLEEEIRRLG